MTRSITNGGYMIHYQLNQAEIYLNAVFNDLCTYEDKPDEFNSEYWREMRECLEMGLQHLERFKQSQTSR